MFLDVYTGTPEKFFTQVIYKIVIQLVKHAADKEYTKTSYICLNIGWEVLSCSEAIAWRSLSEQLIH
jgi:hypothetical protein